MIANLHKLKVVLIGAFALTLTNTAQAQDDHFKCSTDAKMKEFYDKNPQARIDRENFLKSIFESRATYDDSTIYTIPVVFHILHKYGIENIPDANVYNQMNILNDDFRDQSFDAALVIPEFQGIKADCKIEFKLATLDPDGNCTNGIEHIYTHEITQGDDYSKLSQWPRDRYLNVWVCDIIGEPGAAGYAYQPAGVDGFNAFADGIILNYAYIGSLSPSNVGRSRALTHEVGHYLVLDHVWGSTNDPTIACGNDGIGDTPITKGHNNCLNKYDYFCDNLAITSTTANPSTYRFDSLLTTSGTTDPSPPITLNDSGLVFSNPIAVNVSANSQTASMFDYEDWGTGATDTASSYAFLTGAIDLTKYYEFTVTPVFGQVYTLTALTFTVSRDTSGVRTWAVRSDANSASPFGANLTATISPANSDLSVQAGNIFYMVEDSTEAEVGCRITLSGADYVDETAPITFRIYGFNSEDITGSFGIDNIAVTGTYGTIENVENYMEYSYCSKMFTEDQKFAMRTTLNQAISYRNNLWTAPNLVLTGTTYTMPASFPDPAAPLCTPKADFSQNEMYICNGGAINFFSECWGGAVTTYAWTFPGGTPATSSVANPAGITFSTPGYHDISLTVSNASGSDTKTKVHSVYVSNTYTDYIGPASENFESSGTSDWWMTENDEFNEALWHRVALSTSASGGYCFKLNNHNPTGSFGYTERLGGNIDALISPSYNLSGLTGGVLSFKYSCATHATVPEDFTEKFKVYSSVDCGKTWLPKSVVIDGAAAVATIQGPDLANAGVSGTGYVPGNSSSLFWETGTITLTAAVAQPNVRFRFEYIASDMSNNMYLDDINITGVIGVDESNNSEFDFDVYPNPLNANESLTLSLEGSTQLMQVVVYDVMGHIIYTKSLMNTNGNTKHEIPMASLSISKGVYFVSVQSKTQKHTKKVVIK